MIASLPLRLCPSQYLGARIAAAPLSPRSPVLSLRRPTTAYYSAPAADQPSPLLTPRSPSLYDVLGVANDATAADHPSPLLTPRSPSLYDVLGVANEATPQEIKAAYRRLARSCHPDTAASGGNEAASADRFMRIHAAYSTLSDPDTCADYNWKLMGILRHRRPAVYSAAKAAPFAGGYGGRSWETGQFW